VERRTAAHAAIGAGLLGAVAAGAIGELRGQPGANVGVNDLDPKFVAAYRKLPVFDAAQVTGAAPHVKGPASASVTFVEFSDFACPACGQAFSDLRELLKTRPDVKLVFRHFPLDSKCNPRVAQQVHPEACQAAAAAECAGRLGRFWEFHDLLFGNQKGLDRDTLFRHARELGLDIAAFRTCLDDPATMDRIAADVDAGTRFGIESTPTLFINGRRIEGSLQHPYWDAALVIEQNAAAPAAGASGGGS
jgi:protein-disulfide isomerase